MIFEGIVYLFQENHVYSQPKRTKYRITLVIAGNLLDIPNFLAASLLALAIVSGKVIDNLVILYYISYQFIYKI
jgi:hypothetical protein